jgi:DNA-binding PadR family transcriptional regulator
MNVPDITHLQFLLLHILKDGDQCGRDLREALASAGKSLSGPGFYQCMSRLEDAGFVRGRYETKVVEGQTIKERWYAITGDGIAARDTVINFYCSSLKVRRTGLASA